MAPMLCFPVRCLRFWFHGDDEPVERLRLLDSYLSQFEAKKVLSSIATQKRLPEPRKVVQHYAAGDAEEGEVPKVRDGVCVCVYVSVCVCV